MPAAASYLSSPKFGYDFVVATTQSSINGTMLAFMNSRQEPVINVCYIADNEGKPLPIDYEVLKQRAGGADPFTIPDGANPATNPDLQKLFQARFSIGFRAQIGVPKVDDPTTLGDVVVLGSNTSAVQFNMYCSQFIICRLDPGNGWGAPPSWMLRSQPKNNPWVFHSLVDLRLSTVDKSAYSTLPPDVQKQIKNMSGTAFSIQQLLFDLSNARLMGLPTITGVDPGSLLYLVLQQYFIGAYFTELQKKGEPLLGCSIVPRSPSAATMTLTNMNFHVNPVVDGAGVPVSNPDKTQEELATLNYLCAADGASLPPAVQFTWNWVDAAGMKDHDGILSINRNTFANYFRHELRTYVPKVCVQPIVTTTTRWPGVWFKWTFTNGQNPTVTQPTTGSVVLKYDYSSTSEDEAGAGGALAAFKLVNSFSLQVEFVENRIVVKQSIVVYTYIRSLQTKVSGNVVDKSITDTYTLGINAEGGLESSLQSVKTDNSVTVNTNGFEDFFTDVNEIGNTLRDSARAFVPSAFNDIPMSTMQKYVFPGGKTFAFKEVAFSDHQDLTAAITYVDPTGPFTALAAKRTGI